MEMRLGNGNLGKGNESVPPFVATDDADVGLVGSGLVAKPSQY